MSIRNTPVIPEPELSRKDEDAPDIKSCEKCMKFFTSESSYKTHLKMKNCAAKPSQCEDEDDDLNDAFSDHHSNKGSKRGTNKTLPFKNKMLEIQRNDLEDNIYTFMGGVGERNAEPSNRSEMVFQNDNQRLTGQTNYSVNKVIRTPYEEPIRCQDEVPEDVIAKSKDKQFLLKLKAELKLLEDKIDLERDHWELRDPMAPEEETQDQFSLMDMRKLILNYPKRKIDLKYAHFSFYLLWVGRISKPPAFKEIFLIMGTYIASYYAVPAHNEKSEHSYEEWLSFFKEFQSAKINPELMDHLKIFDEINAKKFVEFYVQWVNIFKTLLL